MQELMQGGDLPSQAGSSTASYTMQELNQVHGDLSPQAGSLLLVVPCPR